MIEILIGVAVLILIWFVLNRRRSRSYAVKDLSFPLHLALLELRRRRTGWVRVEGGDHFLQFCIVEDVDKDVLVLDMPALQFQIPDVKALLDFGFTDHFSAFERRMGSSARATAVAMDVFQHLFNWPENKQVKIVEGR